jgi:hypothetical protein
MEKNAFMPWIFSSEDLDVMARLRSALDPSGSFNPSKVLPTSEAHAGAGQPAAAPRAIREDMWI